MAASPFDNDEDEFMPFAPGDLVSRDGTDVHRVVSRGPANDVITVVCVKEPAERWTRLGQVETNLARRYLRVGPVLDFKEQGQTPRLNAPTNEIGLAQPKLNEAKLP